MTALEKKGAARAVADVGGGIILATVDIAAPPERVFRALTSSDEIVRWWGSADTYRTETWEGDLRPGGAWRATGRDAGGEPYSVEGEFLEVDPPRKIVQTWKAAWDGGQVTTITVCLDAIAGGTRVTLRHEGFADRGASCRAHAEGWERVLGWLAAHAAVGEGVAAPPRRFFLCKLIPPRPTFALDMSDAERKVMQEHVVYWTEMCRRGIAVVFGPVADPKGGWGVGVLRVGDEAELRELEANDPAIRSERGFRYEVLPMPVAVTRA